MKDTKYKSDQREQQTLLLQTKKYLFYGATGGGFMYLKNSNTKKYEWKQYDDIIPQTESVKNLYKGIIGDSLNYFHQNQIAWWRQNEDRYFPTGHLLSSQIHCLNHLFYIRHDYDAVLAIIQAIGQPLGINFDDVLDSPIDVKEKDAHSYISFEFTFNNCNLLPETHQTRGENCTSVDAVIYAKAGNDYWLIPIEWKYTEAYDHKNTVYKPERYLPLVDKCSRINSWSNQFSKEPFFELGRQTLFMEQIIKKKQIKADNFLHLIIIPTDNTEMRADAEKFKVQLKDDYKPFFQIIDPQVLLNPLNNFSQYKNLLRYLRTRYWKVAKINN